MYTHIYVYIYIHIYRYIYTDIYIYKCSHFMCIYIYKYSTPSLTSGYVTVYYIYINLCIRIHVCMDVNACSNRPLISK